MSSEDKQLASTAFSYITVCNENKVIGNDEKTKLERATGQISRFL